MRVTLLRKPLCTLFNKSNVVTHKKKICYLKHCHRGLLKKANTFSKEQEDKATPLPSGYKNIGNDELASEDDTPSVDIVSELERNEKAITLQIGDLNLSVKSLRDVLDLCFLISPFFFWGTGMVVMKLLSPHTSPLFVGAIRLLPAGFVLLLWAALQDRKQPNSPIAWLSITLFALIDGTCFQGFLAEGLQRTSAGLGSVIIDSQPLTVAVLASIFYNEKLSRYGAVGLLLGILGLLMLEIPQESFEGGAGFLVFNDIDFSHIWDRGEWWMLLAAQSMAIGTIMVRWVSKYSDPIVATGWHMIIGSLPLLALAYFKEYDILSTRLPSITPLDIVGLSYVFLFGGAISFGIFFDNATKGNLTQLSSLTFLTPIFATASGYLVLNEQLDAIQLIGGIVTCAAVLLINSSRNN